VYLLSRSVLRWPSSRAAPSRLVVSPLPLPLSWWWLLMSTRGPIGGGRLLPLLIVGSDDERAPRLTRASGRVGAKEKRARRRCCQRAPVVWSIPRNLPFVSAVDQLSRNWERVCPS